MADVGPRILTCKTAPGRRYVRLGGHILPLREILDRRPGALRRLVGGARSLADLELIGRLRDYKEGWATHVWARHAANPSWRARP